MHRMISITLLIFLTIHRTCGMGHCTCICCRGTSCTPIAQPAFDVPSCDVDNKCNAPCCQRYPEVCFPLPGPGVVDSVCQNVTMYNLDTD